jgi:beta-galactosidase
MKKRLPIALWYGLGNVTPTFEEDIIERDFKRIKDLGFKYIRIWVNWRDFEPQPRKYNIDRIRILMETAGKYDLNVIAQIYLEFAPDWLPKLYSDALYVDEAGNKLYPQGSPGVCLDHPRVRRDAEEFLTTLAKVLASYPNFYAWDVWSEPQIVQWVFRLGRPRPIYCYCPHTVRRFREWLKAKYDSIEKLNEAWHRSFASFDEVEPPRFVVLHYGTENIDFIEFLTDKLKEDLEWRVKTIRAVDKDHLITSHAPTTSLFLNPLYGNPDDWKMAEAVDVWGTSLYPKHAHRIVDNVMDAFILDAIRSSAYAAGKEFWIGELQGGQGVGGLRIVEPVTPEDIRVWIWQSIAHGAKGINIYHSYPMMWGYESSGYGLLNADGSITDRALVAVQQAKVIAEYEDLFLKLKPLKADVAILYNSYVYRMLWIFQEMTAEKPAYSMLGLYRILYKNKVPIDILSSKQVEKGDVARYKLLLAPFSLTLSRAMAQRLREFVSQGGVLVADARFGWFKEDGWIDEEIPAYSMKEVVGVVEKMCRSADKTQIVISKDVFGITRGTTLNGVMYEETFKPISDVDVIGVSKTGDAAIVSHKYGKGLTLLVGTNIGLAYENLREPTIERLVMGLVDYANVSKPIDVVPPSTEVEVQILSLNSETVLVIINHSESEQVVELLFKRNFVVSKIKDLLSNYIYEVKENKLVLKMLPRSVIVGYVER